MNTCFIDLDMKADIFMRKPRKSSNHNKFMLKKPHNY